MSMAEPVVTATLIGKRYGARPAVEGVTLAAMAGTITGLVGANGGGKTTTLHLIAGLLRPDAGSGTVLGRPLGHPASRARIGLMPQQCALYPELTVRENLTFRAAVHGVADCGRDTLAAYGLESVADVRIATLSGGWSRRANFAGAVLHAPPLILLDEPTSGLDVATRARMWGWIEALAAKGGAVIISTHDLIEAERCDSVLLYEAGIASAQATPAALRAEHGMATLEDVVRATARD